MRPTPYIIAACLLCTPMVTKAKDGISVDNRSVLGSWEGKLLPPGISSFEVIKNTVNFQSDGIFVVFIEKPTGTFRRDGSYSLKKDVLTLDYATGTGDCEQYRLTQMHAELILEPLEQGNDKITLIPIRKPK